MASLACTAAFLSFCLLAAAPLTDSEAPLSDGRSNAAQEIVVSVSNPASEVGLAVLRSGGNAVDAAVATAFALAVTWPAAGNIGGGGFMMIHPAAGQRPVCVEYRETAPAAAQVRMLEQYARSDGHLVCGIPGTVAGLALAHQTYGRQPWSDLVLPAVRLAREGITVNAPLASSLNGALHKSQEFLELQRVFTPPVGKEWRNGDRLVQPELAQTLERIATEGPQAFYTGAIADQIMAEMRAGEGLLTKQDLADYRAHLREPIHGTYRGYDVFGPPPPSSGGICLVEMLNILENFSLNESRTDSTPGNQDAVWSVRTMHLMIEAMRRAYYDRARWLGDSDFVKLPPELTTKEYARQLACQIDLQRHTPSESLAADIPLADESPETTHFSVLDRDGMAVANTYTLENSFGCRVVVRGAGFLLNNEMTDFNRVPNRTDRQGMIGTPANLIAPGKRMLSSQTPTLVFRDGRLILVTGSPGGRTIINTVLCTIVGLVDFQRNSRAMTDAPRLHHQWFPDRSGFEGLARPEYAAALDQLRRMGHAFADKPGKQGDAHSICIDPQTGRWCGVADHRIDGHAAGM
ncbi:MAG: gamma-glutamyltransferase [Planctomycetota bacterium]|nr:gamma-glutamyltransferase [Planctomycetota bacterium]